MKKNIVIIGGSSGIGAELVQQLKGENTVYNYSRTLIDEAGVQSFSLDVTEEINPDIFPDQIDGIIYCPGSINLKPIKSMKMDAIRQDMELNFFGAVKVIKACIKKLNKETVPSIVFFSTVATKQGMAFHTSVASAKSALEGFSISLAAELAPKVRSNCVSLSLTDTPLAKKLLSTDEKRVAAAQRHPLKKIGNVKEIAELVSFLMSDKSAWMTGQVLSLDGGMSSIRSL